MVTVKYCELSATLTAQTELLNACIHPYSKQWYENIIIVPVNMYPDVS